MVQKYEDAMTLPRLLPHFSWTFLDDQSCEQAIFFRSSFCYNFLREMNEYRYRYEKTFESLGQNQLEVHH